VDGNELFYRRATREPLGGTSVAGGSIPRLMGIDVNTDPSPRFTNEHEFPTEGMQVFFGNRDYDISADGERFIVIFPEGEVVSTAPARPAIDVVQNWFSELRERVPVPRFSWSSPPKSVCVPLRFAANH
jgi:hypothetical protein